MAAFSCWVVLVMVVVVFCSLAHVRAFTRPEWVPSVNLSTWYTPLDQCILQNDTRLDIDLIISDCRERIPQSDLQVPRCTVGNAWRGPQKSPFCAAEDIPYTERTHFRNAIKGYDDPSQRPLEEFFMKLARRKGALLLIGDSVQQQFMGAMACELEREGVWPDPKQFWNTDEMKLFVPKPTTNTDPASTTVLQPVPIKFAAIYHFVNGRYDRIVNASMHALRQSVHKFVSAHDTVVIIVNMGLHYVPTPVQHFSRPDYISQMHDALVYLNSIANEQATLGKEVRILWRETTAQHFDTPNGCKCSFLLLCLHTDSWRPYCCVLI
jgi:hypothetical protein